MPRTQKNNYVPLCFHAPEWLLREIEQAISRKEFPNRSDAVRQLLAIGWTVWRVLATLKQYENREREADSELDKMLLPGRT